MGLLELFDGIESRAHAEAHHEGVVDRHDVVAKPNVRTIPFNQSVMDVIKAGYAVRVWLGVVDEWAWWVRGEAEREKLLAEGEKEPIYALGELAVIVNMGDQDVKNMHALKRDMGAVIRPRDR